MDKRQEFRDLLDNKRKIERKMILPRAIVLIILLLTGGIAFVGLSAFVTNILLEQSFIYGLASLFGAGGSIYGAHKSINAIDNKTGLTKNEAELVRINAEIGKLIGKQNAIPRTNSVQLVFPPTQRKNMSTIENGTRPKYNYDNNERIALDTNVAEAKDFNGIERPFVSDVPDFLTRGRR